MKLAMVMKVVAALTVLATTQAQAESLRLGQAAYGGTGCPAGSASVTVSPDQSSLSILFDSYVTEAGNTTGKTIDRKSCNISIPVTVPNGYSVAVFQVDYRGFTAVPRGAQARFDAEYFWAGSRGFRVSRVFAGPYNDNYTVSDGLLATTMVWTPCGASVNLRANTSMMAQTNSRREQTLATVDSADISSGLVYHLQWRRCN
ncbi:DUF4360 domain-containing protein [Bdellovibrio svalbardensis]|uniref:DUF4360 domain-containing protein n=1 Tax=Bdellovibrio svalbardensis TaxID=2972972 RepID=A0ABT6DEI2_9BACT|nr:DUF4360 domain-containing protein [Bdellovibrio svalbardensis]MDG0815250.1 DUF4360 domain-containing protein [Bdellovibrio svalbardensis]